MTRIRARKAAPSARSKLRGRKRRGKNRMAQIPTSSRKSPVSESVINLTNAEAEKGSVVNLQSKTSRKVQREKGWIVSGDQPPITGTRRFVVPLKGTPSRKDSEREKHLLLQASRFEQEFREVKASRFAVAFGFRPGKTAVATGVKKQKKLLKMKDIARGKVGFTRTTANQRFREQELKVTREAKLKARKKFVSGAEDRVFFLHHH